MSTRRNIFSIYRALAHTENNFSKLRIRRPGVRVPSSAPKEEVLRKRKTSSFFVVSKLPREGTRTARPAGLRPGRVRQSGGLSERARERGPFQRTKEEVLQKCKTSSFLLFPECLGNLNTAEAPIQPDGGFCCIQAGRALPVVSDGITAGSCTARRSRPRWCRGGCRGSRHRQRRTRTGTGCPPPSECPGGWRGCPRRHSAA